MSENANEKFRTEGRTAFDRGAKESECPYEWESTAGEYWRLGYALGGLGAAWMRLKTALINLFSVHGEVIGMFFLAVICFFYAVF